MAETTAPGVFIEEIERGPRPIEGVATSTAAFLGETERGSIKPRLVTSFNEYLRHFGRAAPAGSFLPDAVGGFFGNGGGRAYICRIAGAGAERAALDVGGLRIEAIGPGQWGNRLFVRLAGPRLQAAYWQTLPDGNAPPDPFAAADAAQPPAVVEEFDDLVWDDPTSPNFYEKRVQGLSTLVRIVAAGAPVAAPAVPFSALAGGTDGAEPGVVDYRGEAEDGDERSGLAALDMDEYREVALVAAPAAANDVAKAVCEHCERNRFRFAVIDCPPGRGDTLDPRSDWETSYGAYYCPWLYVADPESGGRRLVPPGGHVLGLYARTDAERGVWKAPANDVLRGIVDVEYDFDARAQETLNPRGVNTIRRFPGRGIRVWGARTLSDNPLWKYISVRRLFIFLERSIYEDTQWVVFEPNDEKLWARVKDTIRLFLRAQWRNGAMMGVTENEAFFIVCDRSTMTQDDILNGRLVCEIGIAAVRPAEFVIFRIFQKTAEAQS